MEWGHICFPCHCGHWSSHSTFPLHFENYQMRFPRTTNVSFFDFPGVDTIPSSLIRIKALSIIAFTASFGMLVKQSLISFSSIERVPWCLTRSLPEYWSVVWSVFFDIPRNSRRRSSLSLDWRLCHLVISTAKC